MFELGRDPQRLSSPAPFSNKLTCRRLLRPVAYEVLNISTYGDSTASFCNPQFSFLMFKWDSLYFSLFTLSCLLSLGISEKNVAPSYSCPFIRYLCTLLRPPCTFLVFFRIHSSSSLSLSLYRESSCIESFHGPVLAHSSSSITLLYLRAQNWVHNSKFGLSRRKGSPSLLATVLMEPRLLTFFVARTHSWLMVNLSTRTLRPLLQNYFPDN